MQNTERGMFARSLAGHDKGTLYVIWDTDKTCFYLVDGKTRPIANPKKKKKKHVQIDRHEPAFRNLTDSWRTVRDEDIRKALRDKQREI